VAGLKVNIYAIHKIAESSPEAAIIANYLKRLPGQVTIQQIETKGKLPPDKQKLYEGDLLLKSIPANNFVIALDENGMQFSSKDFSIRINKIIQPISFIIGGAYGLSKEIKSRANLLLSLGSMTMPHILARVILVEQIYRAYTINENHPYHK
jgi:23S rRNA (pseudouridine1915-N3)-methyltransferase